MALELPLVPQSRDNTCGAACFESMVRYLTGESRGEMVWAELLDNRSLGYTPPENIVLLARDLGLEASLREGARAWDLFTSYEKGEVVFVTWWDEDAGHYSLIKHISEEGVELMDPLTAREGRTNTIPLKLFLSYWELRGRKLIRVSRSQA